ncbi:type II toxin-antitoxin system VapC family toxin [Mucilaginibacter psychrotolerans]|uniref:PIN domain-containing protein n=1 Tax=Mucilaginibacter psychrotolerans TaxID=1524096 RepID=A0A4Y8RYR9_9SPHI|nr:PIN domain-containing protein [Mucilaginibacter psychrotolerans]
MSIINRIEVLGHSSATEGLASFIDTAIIHHLSEEIIEQTIALRKIIKIKLPDAIIAATAITHGHRLITRNVRDFKNIAGLEVIDPYQI